MDCTKGRITVSKAKGVRCERCWRYVADVSTEPGREGICERCVIAILENRLYSMVRWSQYLVDILKDEVKEPTMCLAEAIRKCESALDIAR